MRIGLAWRMAGALAVAMIVSHVLQFFLSGAALFFASFMCGWVAYYVARYA